jgi:hypothetical protein
MPAPAKRKRTFWRVCRIYFRRARMTVWIVVLLLLGALIYLNLIGLPDFVKRPIVSKLRERGLDLEFSELTLHFTRGFVAADVRFGSMDSPAAPQLTAKEVEFNLHLRALIVGKVQVDSVAMRGGKLEWTLTQTNLPDRTLTIEKIESSIRLLPNDRWILDDLHGRFGGADFFFSGSLANASAVKDWKFGTDETSVDATRWPRRLRTLADTLEKIKFTAPPELRLDVNGDARDLKTFNARFMVKARDADTPWGRATKVHLTTQIFPAASNELTRAEIGLQTELAETRWATITNLDVQLRGVTFAPSPDLVDCAGTIRIDGAETPWGSVALTQVKGSWQHTVTNLMPQSAAFELHSDFLATWLTRASQVDLTAKLKSVTNAIEPSESLTFWNEFLSYTASWKLSVGALRTLSLQAENISTEGEWFAPQLDIASLKAELFSGSLDARTRLDIVTREASFEAASDFDLQKLSPLLTEKSREWLQKFSWQTPPRANVAGALVLPPWNEPDADWQSLVRPTIKLAGHVAVTNGSYLGIHADWVTTHLSYTNLTWQLPDLAVGRPEGGLRLSHIANDETRRYYFKLHSAIDPRAVLPLLDANVRRGFDLCDFGAVPVMDGELWGKWYDHESVGFRGSIALTNFAFRGQRLDSITTGLNYSNLVLTCIEPRVWRGTQSFSADGITADFNSSRVHVTNGVGNIEPAFVVRMIGPVTERVMSPYHFGQPPNARVNGYISMHDPQDADIVFEGSGRDFESLRFRIPEYQAKVVWQNEFLTVTNTSGSFYGGSAAGWARFVFDQESTDASYVFSLDVTNANLHNLVADLTESPNTLDGLLTGRLNVTNATTADIRSWDGYGYATLSEGLLWELPIFGALSGPLDAISPGFGNSRFTRASGTYKIEKGVIESKNLEMRSAAMRLQYSGWVNFDGEIRARVEAEPLRDTPIIGPVMNTLLTPLAKLFSYRIRGTMKEPVIKTENIPSFIASPLDTIGKIFSGGQSNTNAVFSTTNAPGDFNLEQPVSP